MSDYEMAFMNAATSVFDGVLMRGCFFHYGQSIWHKIQTCGLQNRYANETEYCTQLKQLYALALVPEDDVEAAYDTLISTKFFRDNADGLQELLEYNEKT
ncbi:GSCOCG00011527001-RA-CDS [Cotesia congregata]|nr:GSCOCG00011527001-RA-CDS [Cotesia congregata]